VGGQTGAKLLFIAQNHPQTVPFVHTTSKSEFVIEKTGKSIEISLCCFKAKDLTSRKNKNQVIFF